MAADFRAQMKIRSSIWVDTDRVAYRKLAFTYGLAKVLSPRSILNSLRSLRKGHFQHRTQGNPLQNGGVLVVRKGGECMFAFVEEVTGDHPKIADVLKAAREAVG